MKEPVSPSPAPARDKSKTANSAAKTTAPRQSVTGKAVAKTAKNKAANPPSVAKPAKPKKPKLVRDSFTIPKDEYGTLAELKQRCAKLDQPSKKSELLRAGIKALAAMSDKALLATLQAVPSIKTGRPKKA